jgi:hypothetical protein
MTLDDFLTATAHVPEPVLRMAMTRALAIEPARAPAAYQRFYGRVIAFLRESGVPPAVAA